jgi:hypothetical protein
MTETSGPVGDRRWNMFQKRRLSTCAESGEEPVLKCILIAFVQVSEVLRWRLDRLTYKPIAIILSMILASVTVAELLIAKSERDEARIDQIDEMIDQIQGWD